ncbi:MAG: hypothetical protein FWF43_09535 [Propionibacteriaceae bacterium]|nr:hypothetical protein [Propionibacteriaceae bacterium]
MSRVVEVVMSAKTLAAMVFSGLMVLYLIGGALVTPVFGVSFNYTVPFIFVIEGLVVSVLISVVWTWLFGDQTHSTTRYFPRLVIFCLAMAVMLTLSVLVFFGWHTDWAKLWWIVMACVMAGIVVVSVIAEAYFRRTGRRYTQILQARKVTQSDQGSV